MRSLKGHLLVASPNLLSPFFTQTVLLMLDHTSQGASGVILNRPTEATITAVSDQVLQESFDWEKPINLGGPVAGPLMVVHTREDLADDQILPGVFSSIDAARVERMIRQKVEPSLVIANYAGWGPGQLEGEIEEDSWLSMPARPAHVFWASDKDLWKTVLQEIQSSSLGRYLGLRDLPGDPSVNRPIRSDPIRSASL
ncbi:YqgE/AlgH family protein [soil metagenome]